MSAWRLAVRLLPRTARLGLERDLLAELSRAAELGASLPGALEAAAEGHPSRILRGAFRELHSSLGAGTSLEEGLAALAPLVDEEIVAAVRAGAEAGRLGPMLGAIETVLDRSALMMARVRDAVLHPAIVVALAVAVALLLGAGPLREISVLSGGLIPPLALAVLATRHPAWAIALCVLLLGGGWLLWVRWGRAAIGEKVLEKVPLLGSLRAAGRTALFSRVLGLLIAAEVPLDRSLRLCARLFPEGDARRRLESSGARVADGEPPWEALRSEPLAGPFLLALLEHPGATGVAAGLARAADFHEAELDRLGEEAGVFAGLLGILVAGVVTGLVVAGFWTGYYSAPGGVF